MSRPRAGDATLVACGAAVGALARWAVTPLAHATVLPWATLAPNVVAAFQLGALPAVPAVRRSRRVALVLGPGVLGGFTTVSAWSGQVTGLAAEGRADLAGLLLVTTVAGVLVAAHAGRRCVRPRVTEGSA